MDEARKINNYTIEHSFNVGEREVVMGVDETKEEPYVVAYAEFFTPACYHLMSKLTYYKTYLDAMSGYCERCSAQVQAMQEEHSKFNFDGTTLTAQDCIPCSSSVRSFVFWSLTFSIFISTLSFAVSLLKSKPPRR